MTPPRGQRGRGGGNGNGDGGEDASGGDERWLITYADLITLLLAMFVVFYAMANQDLEKYEALAESLREGFSGPAMGRTIPFGEGGADTPIGGGGPTRRTSPVRIFDYPRLEQELNRQLQEMLEEREGEVSGAEIEFSVDERGVAIDIHPGELLFPSGSAQIREDFEPILAEIASAIGEVDNPVQIEGHTDSQPIDTFRFPSNWELSSARASSVLRFIQQQGVSRDRLSAAGYADTRPVASNDTPEGRAENRRVRIVIMRGDRGQQGQQNETADGTEDSPGNQPEGVSGS